MWGGPEPVNGYLLDTNVVSQLRKRSTDTALTAWRASVADAEVYLSVLVIGEIRQGIEGLNGAIR
jgi:predicted nucleic acid-binding protein